MHSKNYEKHLYLNPAYQFITQSEITEYDMKEAGFNIIKQFKILPEHEIEMLSMLSKRERTIQIGKLQRRTKGLSQMMNKGFAECRRWFFYMNDLQDEDVLSIKKDAIFTLKKCDHTDVGLMHFAEKNEYDKFVHLDKKEIYIGDKIDVKGINDELVSLHQGYILDIIQEHLHNLVYKNNKKQVEFMKDVLHYYKTRQLDIGYYREFNRDSEYRLNIHLLEDDLGIKYTNELENIDISYNYMNILIPLIRSI